MTVLLNGKYVEDGLIDPKKHRFIGMFRRPYESPKANLLCKCGHILEYEQSAYDHWLSGHWDIPQYADIKEGD